MSFVVPLIGMIGAGIASGGAALGGLLGAGAAAEGAAVAGGAAAASGAATGILGTGLSGWQALQLGGSLFSGLSQYQAGQQQAAAYQLQATNALIQGNQQAQEYQRQGIAVLNRTIETRALIGARAGAGGIDPYSGSPGALTEYAMAKGVDEYNWARTNTLMSNLSGQANQAAYLTAADSASSSGLMNALGTGLMGAVKLKAIG